MIDLIQDINTITHTETAGSTLITGLDTLITTLDITQTVLQMGIGIIMFLLLCIARLIDRKLNREQDLKQEETQHLHVQTQSQG